MSTTWQADLFQEAKSMEWKSPLAVAIKRNNILFGFFLTTSCVRAVIFHLPVLNCLVNVSDRCSRLPWKTPKPSSPCQGLTPSQQTWCVAQSELHVLISVPTDKGLWLPQTNVWLTEEGEGAPRGGSDSENTKCGFWSWPSDSAECSLLAEGVCSDVFFQFIPAGECIGQNGYSNGNTAPKSFKYFEIAKGFYLQNTPLSLEADIYSITQRSNQVLSHWYFDTG